jgi:hypothetical protein
MTAEERVETALRSKEPVPALRRLVEDLGREGSTRTEMSRLFEDYLERVRAHPESHKGDEDAILDVLDALTGWCHPGAELLPEKPV